MASPLHAHEVGEGLPIVIIHGWELRGEVEALDFEPVFSKLPNLRRIYVDLPGMGKTPADNVKDLDDMYLRLVQFIDARLGDSRFLLVGSSCGAYLARAVARKYGERVDGLLLRVPVIEPETSKRDLDPFIPLVTNQGAVSQPEAGDEVLPQEILIQTPDYVEALRKKYKEGYLPATEASDAKVLSSIREDPDRYRLSPEKLEDKRKYLAPTLVLCGRHDATVGYRDSLRLLELYPRSTYVVLDRGTHGLPIDETGLFAALVRDWITRVKEWRVT